jgi:hypothetical protein
MKKHGFDLESTMLHDFLKLSRLTLAVAFLYVWAISVGFRFIKRRLTNGLSVQIPLCSYL